MISANVFLITYQCGVYAVGLNVRMSRSVTAVGGWGGGGGERAAIPASLAKWGTLLTSFSPRLWCLCAHDATRRSILRTSSTALSICLHVKSCRAKKVMKNEFTVNFNGWYYHNSAGASDASSGTLSIYLTRFCNRKSKLKRAKSKKQPATNDDKEWSGRSSSKYAKPTQRQL